MATIENRSGTYRVRIRRQGAPTLSRTFTDPVSAQTWADETERAIQTGTLAQHQHRQTTLAQLLHAYSINARRRKKARGRSSAGSKLYSATGSRRTRSRTCSAGCSATSATGARPRFHRPRSIAR